jgi:hypothetical protein
MDFPPKTILLLRMVGLGTTRGQSVGERPAIP